MSVVNPKKVFELDKEFGDLKYRMFQTNNLVFFKDYEQLVKDHDRYHWSDITTTVWGSGLIKRIPECNGTKTLASIKEILRPNHLRIDDKSINEISYPTKECKIEVHKVLKDVTYGNAFYSFKKDLNDLCFTQHQICVFFEKFHHRLNCDSGNFFLSKIDNQFVIFNLFVSDSDDEWMYHLLEFESYKKDSLFAISKTFIVIPT